MVRGEDERVFQGLGFHRTSLRVLEGFPFDERVKIGRVLRALPLRVFHGISSHCATDRRRAIMIIPSNSTTPPQP